MSMDESIGDSFDNISLQEFKNISVNSIDISESTKRPSGPGLRISVSSSRSKGGLGEDFDVTQSGSFQKGKFRINRTWKDKFSLDDLDTSTLLGQGASGVVYKAFNRKTKKWIALKLISVFDSVKRDQIQKELETLVFVPSNNKYVVGFNGAFYQEGTIYLALEYMEGGSLQDLYTLTSPGRMDEACVSIVTMQVLAGLEYLHKRSRTVHRDIKPSNILMNKNGQFKITDFGVSSKKDRTMSVCNTFVGTITYMSPERLNGTSYTFNSDIWSLGISVVEIATGDYPFKQDGKSMKNFWELLNHLKKNKPPALSKKEGFSDEIIDFVDKCLQMEPKDRMNCEQLLCHPFITKHRENPMSWGKFNKWYEEQIQKLYIEREKAPKYNVVKQDMSSALDKLEF